MILDSNCRIDFIADHLNLDFFFSFYILSLFEIFKFDLDLNHGFYLLLGLVFNLDPNLVYVGLDFGLVFDLDLDLVLFDLDFDLVFDLDLDLVDDLDLILPLAFSLIRSLTLTLILFLLLTLSII